ncbi:MAG TPA: hypothetical protein VFO31_06930, partial [Vicinamibacterales bacterium]|nr:hypothetical protein [Vicinamibacterales bacterium]
HVLDWPDRTLSLPSWGARVTSAKMLGSGETVAFTDANGAITLTLPAPATGQFDRVVVLETMR